MREQFAYEPPQSPHLLGIAGAQQQSRNHQHEGALPCPQISKYLLLHKLCLCLKAKHIIAIVHKAPGFPPAAWYPQLNASTIRGSSNHFIRAIPLVLGDHLIANEQSAPKLGRIQRRCINLCSRSGLNPRRKNTRSDKNRRH